MCVSVKGSEDNKRSFGLKVDSGRWHCFRCGSFGRVGDGGPEPEQSVVELLPSIEMSLPDDFLLLSEEPALSSQICRPAYEYLERRGVSGEAIRLAGIGVSFNGKYAQRIIIPVNSGGSLRGFVARAWTKVASSPRYLYPAGMQRAQLIYNADALCVETRRPLLIVEGVFDSLPFLHDAVALLGKPSEGQISQLIVAKRPLVVVLDGDAWREGMALALRLRFEGAEAGFIRLPPDTDPAEANHTEIRNRVTSCWKEEIDDTVYG